MSGEPRDYEAARRAILRRATLYTWGFLGAGLGVAVGGSALVAWLLARSGRWPFLETWIGLTALVLLPTLIGLVVRAVRERMQVNAGGELRPGEDDPDTWPKTKP